MTNAKEQAKHGKLTVNIVSGPNSDQGQKILDSNGAFFAKVYSTYNAKTIVRAVNSHDALVNVLERVKELADSGDIPNLKDWTEYGQICAALARAKGNQ